MLSTVLVAEYFYLFITRRGKREREKRRKDDDQNRTCGETTRKLENKRVSSDCDLNLMQPVCVLSFMLLEEGA